MPNNDSEHAVHVDHLRQTVVVQGGAPVLNPHAHGSAMVSALIDKGTLDPWTIAVVVVSCFSDGSLAHLRAGGLGDVRYVILYAIAGGPITGADQVRKGRSDHAKEALARGDLSPWYLSSVQNRWVLDDDAPEAHDHLLWDRLNSALGLVDVIAAV